MQRVDNNANGHIVFGRFIRPNMFPFRLQNKTSVFRFCSQSPCPPQISELVPFGKSHNIHFVTLADVMFFKRKEIIRVKLLNASDMNEINGIIRLSDKDIALHPLVPEQIKKDAKLAKVRLIEKYYREQGLIDGHADETLFDHASREYAIIESMIRDKKPPLDSLGIPSEANQISLVSVHDKLKPIFTSITDRELAFIKYLLLLHDIGKIEKGDGRPHERRSGEMLGLIFANSFNELTNTEKEVLKIVITNHSLIDRIENNPENQQSFITEILIPIFKVGLSLKVLEGIIQIWLLFRLAEKAQSEHFGIIEKEYSAVLSNLYNIAMQLAKTC